MRASETLCKIFPLINSHFTEENPSCLAVSRLILLLKSYICYPPLNNVNLHSVVLYNYEQIFQLKWPRKLFIIINMIYLLFLVFFLKLIECISLV